MEEYKVGDEVSVTIKKFTNLGIVAEIEGTDETGLIYKDDIYAKVNVGEKHIAYIRFIREDGKLDLTFRKPGYRNFIDSTSTKILTELHKAGGFLKFNDKSSPESIKKTFQISKKQFKQSIGRLYKEGKITISDEGITSTSPLD